MKTEILNTDRLYAHMLSRPDCDRAAFFDQNLLQPFSPMFELMNLPRRPDLLGCLALSGSDRTMEEMLAGLIDSDAWNRAHTALERAGHNLQKAGVNLPERLLLGIFLADP
jgi:hypothetical protein